MVRRRSRTASEVEESINEEPVIEETSFDSILSTGSTLLDLAISGNRIRGGGLPGGIIIEVFGPSSSGKTAILSEIGANAANRGGEILFLDPEARLDKEYSRIYGLDLKENNYKRPDTVSQMFDLIWEWEPDNASEINVIAADSLASLSTDTELADGDAYGMRRAKEFSEGLRKTCRVIANNSWIIACSNQEREGPGGIVTPGGKGIPYYASLRIRIKPMYPQGKIFRNRKIGTKNVKKAIGIQSLCEVKKSSIDDPFRQVPIFIIFNYGIDDIRGNLQWLKDMKGDPKYFTDSKFMEKAIQNVEADNLESDLKELVIDMWQEIETKFKTERKEKQRS